MTDLVSRHIHHPPAFPLHPMDPLHTTTSLLPFGSSGSIASRLSSTCSLRSSTVTDGLRTPPPEMTTASYTEASFAHSNGSLKQFNPMAQDPGVSKTLDSFRSSQQHHSLQRLASASPLQPHPQAYSSQNNQSEELRRRGSKSAASMVVPDSISSTRVNLADFAAQVGFAPPVRPVCVRQLLTPP